MHLSKKLTNSEENVFFKFDFANAISTPLTMEGNDSTAVPTSPDDAWEALESLNVSCHIYVFVVKVFN